ncbi:MAG: hypothetical protein ACXAC8_10370 [Candidatus Hodarchaeales archaeon]|jgi:hypothetical protein
MKDKWQIIPKRIGRSRKIQVRQFEPEEIWIEYELDVKDPSMMSVALQEATSLAVSYLDEEEKKLRRKSQSIQIPNEKKKSITYRLQITREGESLGNFRVKESDDPQFANFSHLWLEIDQQELYVGYLLKDTGDFKFKSKNKELIKQHRIAKGKHFRVIEN